MSQNAWERRDFLKSLLAGLPLVAWDWSAFPRGRQDKTPAGTYDAVVIDAGLGGLSAAATNYKGVFTRDRRPKMAAHFLQSPWAEN